MNCFVKQIQQKQMQNTVSKHFFVNKHRQQMTMGKFKVANFARRPKRKYGRNKHEAIKTKKFNHLLNHECRALYNKIQKSIRPTSVGVAL